jgi:hypothetical protein
MQGHVGEKVAGNVIEKNEQQRQAAKKIKPQVALDMRDPIGLPGGGMKRIA